MYRPTDFAEDPNFIIMIYLASKSPRRCQLLEQLGVEYETLEIDIDESWDGVETARDYVERLALEKARAGKSITNDNISILAADTEVVLDDHILGKPQDMDHAIAMLQMLSGRTHHVYSAVALVNDSEQLRITINHVCFKPLTLAECEAYSESGEPMGKAGAYAIQGKASAFISRLEGSYSGVMGLPLFETAELLKTIHT